MRSPTVSNYVPRAFANTADSLIEEIKGNRKFFCNKLLMSSSLFAMSSAVLCGVTNHATNSKKIDTIDLAILSASSAAAALTMYKSIGYTKLIAACNRQIKTVNAMLKEVDSSLRLSIRQHKQKLPEIIVTDDNGNTYKF